MVFYSSHQNSFQWRLEDKPQLARDLSIQCLIWLCAISSFKTTCLKGLYLLLWCHQKLHLRIWHYSLELIQMFSFKLLFVCKMLKIKLSCLGPELLIWLKWSLSPQKHGISAVSGGDSGGKRMWSMPSDACGHLGGAWGLWNSDCRTTGPSTLPWCWIPTLGFPSIGSVTFLRSQAV